MRSILTPDGALAWCSTAVVRDGVVVGARLELSSQGAALAAMAPAVLRARAVGRVAVRGGPGSVTALRAAGSSGPSRAGVIEAADSAHAEALACIHSRAFPEGERWGADAMALQLGLPGAFGFIDAEGGMVLARVAADEAEILTLAVLPE